MFYADLHVHSKFSRATSRDCDLERLALWAARKGIAVVGTGDFTHPGWFAEIQEKLVAAEPGLFRLRPDLENEVLAALGSLAAPVRFMLEVEISTIYKKAGRTRKVHHLIYAPGLDAAERVTASLARIGNLKADGRPILGLDSRNLLDIALEADRDCWLVPAHIWTPWFSVVGSKSGFDTIDECYGDLAGEVFALESGLSSDPPMNWRVSSLDRYALVANSDAHSPPKLGREACAFDTPLDYFAMRGALRTGQGYCGRVEFFPEEGKYHLDGHRKCGICLEPDQTRRHGGICPACGKPLTLGVMYRVQELADRPAAPDPLPPRAAPVRSLIPLEEILGEVHGVGPQSKLVQQSYEDLLSRLGPELFILEQAPMAAIARAGSTLLAEAIARMRRGQVIRQAGYDGEYGTIRLFTEEELRRGSAVGLLFDMAEPEEHRVGAVSDGDGAADRSASETPGATAGLSTAGATAGLPSSAGAGILDGLDPQQRAAAEATDGAVLIVAGPGTGKTRTLTHRLAHLVADLGVPPEHCLTLCFSRRAAGEMIDRLDRLLPGRAERIPVMTFHALGLSILKEHGSGLGLSESVRVATEEERAEMLAQCRSLSPRAAGQLLARISRRRRQGPVDDPTAKPEDAQAMAVYQRELRARGWVDFDDLIALPLQLLQEDPALLEHYRSRYRWVSVDECQDLDAAQYQLLRLLAPTGGNVCAIGDPDQSIYGFRGADADCFWRFCEDFPGARTITLGRNYRSTQTIVDAALQLIAPASLAGDRWLEASALGPEQIEIHACTSDRAEAEHVVHSIERLLGGSTFFSLDSRRAAAHEGESLSFADVAVLYRTEAQSGPLVEALERSGMPVQRRSHRPLPDDPLTTDADLWDPRADRVSLLTLHAAKGLEFPVVFIVGCEDGLLPLHWGAAETDPQAMAEERRLLFVGMTRARQRLVLSHARRRLWQGKVRPTSPSPFLEDVQQRLVAMHQHRAVKKPVSLDRQRMLFQEESER